MFDIDADVDVDAVFPTTCQASLLIPVDFVQYTLFF